MDLPAEQTLIARRNGHALHADALPRSPYAPGPRRASERAALAALTLVALLAAALRSFRLDYQSLWYDEGVTARANAAATPAPRPNSRHPSSPTTTTAATPNSTESERSAASLAPKGMVQKRISR